MTNKIVKMIVIAGVALAAVPALSACNTIEGAGKDVQAGGEAVSDAAKDAKN
ncbi:entericidin A/B family lipoprotein [Asticcacaulis sp.]|uniref:entericidin A/B family lipoprotein n=1 Tax=Asticcacaulis sp. TaxID=1872648 RepID=UPI00263137E7|nr:entericidin A/B family lipoprotein [Asticcacaulis sp.]